MTSFLHYLTLPYVSIRDSISLYPISLPESSFPFTSGRKRELWEQPLQACALDADCVVKQDGHNSVISFVISKRLLPELKFSDRWSRGTKTLGTRLPCTKNELTHMRTRFSNAAASPALRRLRSAGSLAINPKILHIIQLLHYKARKYFIYISCAWWTAATIFQKNLQFDYLFLEIFRLQLSEGTISTHGLQP